MLNFLKFLFLLVFITSDLQVIKAQNASELLKKMDQLISAPKDKQADVKMILTSKDGSQKIREATLLQKGAYKKLYRYTKPADKAGIATLSLPGGIMWLSMPSFNKPIKVSLLSNSQAFNGTDFSSEDMSGIPYGDKYIAQLADSDLKNTYLLELIPNGSKTNYSKIMAYVDKVNYYPVKMIYFNKSNRADKIALYQYVKKGGYWFAQEVIMTDLKNQHSTSIILSNVKFDQGLKDEAFSVENLKKQ